MYIMTIMILIFFTPIILHISMNQDVFTNIQNIYKIFILKFQFTHEFQSVLLEHESFFFRD